MDWQRSRYGGGQRDRRYTHVAMAPPPVSMLGIGFFGWLSGACRNSLPQSFLADQGCVKGLPILVASDGLFVIKWFCNQYDALLNLSA